MDDASIEPTLKRVAAITTVRNDTMFLEKWVQYYGRQFGLKNLYVFIDGHDQPLPEWLGEINTIVLPHLPLKRARADARRAQVMSHMARGLFKYFDAVIVTDVDEFLIVDPNVSLTLAEYLFVTCFVTCGANPLTAFRDGTTFGSAKSLTYLNWQALIRGYVS